MSDFQVVIPKRVVFVISSLMKLSNKEVIHKLIFIVNKFHEECVVKRNRKPNQHTYSKRVYLDEINKAYMIKLYRWAWRGELRDIAISMPVVNGNLNVNFSETLNEAAIEALEKTLLTETDEGDEDENVLKAS